MGKKLTLLFIGLFLALGTALAQTTVNGVVIGNDNVPVIGASILVQGTKVGSATDLDGRFSINSPVSNPTLVVSYVGMKTQKVKGGQNMKIILYPDDASQTLGEVVVTGIQKMDKRLFTGATTKVDAEKARSALALRWKGILAVRPFHCR